MYYKYHTTAKTSKTPKIKKGIDLFKQQTPKKLQMFQRHKSDIKHEKPTKEPESQASKSEINQKTFDNKISYKLNASETKDEKGEQFNVNLNTMKMESSKSDGQCKVKTKERVPISFRQSPKRAKK